MAGWSGTVRIFWCALAFSLASSTFAQEAPTEEPEESMREVLEAREQAEELIREYEASSDNGRSAAETPRASILGLVADYDYGRYAQAANYLDLRVMPRNREDFTPQYLVRALALMFARQNILDFDRLSDAPEGSLDDGLPADLEQIGSLTISSGEVPIYLQRVPGDAGRLVWKISGSTVQKIPAMWDELGMGPFALFLHERLPAFRFLGMENWQVVSALLFCLLAWPLATLTTVLIRRAIQRFAGRYPAGMDRFLRLPLRIFLFILYLRLLMDQLGLSEEARVLLDSSGIDYVGYTVLILGLITLARDYQIRRAQAAENYNLVGLIRPMTNIVRVIAVIVIALTWAESAGYNMSTILAGLGVGSLAVALAAQKTLENLIGGITIYTARPVSIGDFCKFGEFSGTVEEIGLRSTTIRTLDRSLLVIPNAAFASMEIENLSARDYIRYLRNMGLVTGDTEQLRLVLAGVRRMLHAHPKVRPGTSSVRLEAIEGATTSVRLEAGVDSREYQEFLSISEDINLRVIDIVRAAGASFADSAQLAIVRGEQEPDPEQVQQVAEMLDDWRAKGKLPFPEYTESEIERLRGTLDYPPRGSGSG